MPFSLLLLCFRSVSVFVVLYCCVCSLDLSFIHVSTMTIASVSILRQKLPPCFSAAALCPRRFIYAAARHHLNPTNVRRQHPQQQPQKNLLKARESFKKQFSSLSPALSPDDKPVLKENEAIGTVAASHANFMRVVVNSASQPLEDSGSLGVELLCVVKAVLKKIKRRVLVGDKVLVGSVDWVDRRGMIENIFQRKSEILDPPVANVDHLVVLFSLVQPKLEPFMLTRFLVEAESTNIPFTLALNKTELVDEAILRGWKSRLRGWGYEAVFCSVDTKLGVDTLQFILRDQTSVIVGPSGVGKSSLINALRGNKSVTGATEDDNWFEPILGSKWFEEQRVGEVSARSGRGKHTTRNVSLLPLSGGGYLADTPGFSLPSLFKVTKQSLAQYFPEIRKMLEAGGPGKCLFSDCLHLGERGCLVRGDWERYSYYLQLLDEIRVREEFQLRTVGTKRESDVRVKVGEHGVKQAEPRLEPKKHRRQSRKKLNQSLLDELDELDDDEDEQDNEKNTFIEAGQ
ncbi:small ribosomal subunit biogenesis GTPase RsgA 1, mitochondrial [Andrographis paniculata]|uniref:small ribosomal subunit biogenesis GTPase RsgA 1, mitochondrial n=1 Tax=Andrographis paniculata TaxID=175694 RepID=UPI0021E83D3A|nr:small ribosomal subunit biogenesis GTPase RsgA 1, mitochondrial [Andrographis paniculata]